MVGVLGDYFIEDLCMKFSGKELEEILKENCQGLSLGIEAFFSSGFFS